LWETFQKEAEEILEKDVQALNEKLWAAGIGAVWRIEKK
jgi:hypothetical protein